MGQKDPLEPRLGLYGDIVVKFDWLGITVEQEELVSPVGEEEENCGNEVQNGHTGREEETNCCGCQNVCVAEFEQEFRPRILLLVLNLSQLSRVLVTVPNAWPTAPIPASETGVGALFYAIQHAHSDNHSGHSQSNCGAHLPIPFLTITVNGAFESENFG